MRACVWHDLVSLSVLIFSCPCHSALCVCVEKTSSSKGEAIGVARISNEVHIDSHHKPKRKPILLRFPHKHTKKILLLLLLLYFSLLLLLISLCVQVSNRSGDLNS